VGEPALVPTAPAILGAIHDAVGVRITQLPATPDRVRAAILAARESATSRPTTEADLRALDARLAPPPDKP
jgi:hypothetical protein